MRRGVTLIDTLVGIALLVIAMVGIVGAFEFSLDSVQNNKARAGAIGLADEQMEYLRSLAYAALGTVGGVPAGNIPQSQTLSLNDISYTERTLIEYVDDPGDGTGSHDANHITEDYKIAKVSLSWQDKSAPRSVEIVGIFIPPGGVETNPCAGACGELLLSVANSQGTPLSGASVVITNSSVSPAVSLTTFANASGTVALLGAPAGSGYHVVVSEPGYSTAQTYAATSQNTSPSPGDLTISSNQITSASFAIDLLGSETISTLAWQNGQSTTTVPNVSVTLQGAKTIGSGPSGLVYKYSQAISSGAAGSVAVPGLEWDSYTASVSGATGYDVASACGPQPQSLSPGGSIATTLYLAAHTSNSLLVDVRAQSNGALISGADVVVSKTGFSQSTSTDPCGNAFFSGLSNASYTVQVGASGHATSTKSNFSISGATRLSVQLQ